MIPGEPSTLFPSVEEQQLRAQYFALVQTQETTQHALDVELEYGSNRRKKLRAQIAKKSDKIEALELKLTTLTYELKLEKETRKLMMQQYETSLETEREVFQSKEETLAEEKRFWEIKCGKMVDKMDELRKTEQRKAAKKVAVFATRYFFGTVPNRKYAIFQNLRFF